ncbi:uncharacterized protein LOC113324976 [Papaver somniferum]|uniref:uncharacterized protein LOC113324976 n=1 Tax=Papaver somniferum TaxID=3469 RepID=UPI000E6FC40E|nr:uncharacterized protein LOC113324976 [Papaver somniferum]
MTRVSAESVLNCKSVCSNWLSVVRHPLFSKKHFHHHLNHAGTLGFIASASTYSSEEFQYFECNENHYESTTPVQRIKRVNLTSPFKKSMSFACSSNGLICLEAESVCICNPITREYVILPKPKEKTYVAGFGYVSSTGEYKVLGILLEFNKQGRHESEFAQVYVYTLGSRKGWRNLGTFTSQFYVLSEWDGPDVVDLYFHQYKCTVVFEKMQNSEHISYKATVVAQWCLPELQVLILRNDAGTFGAAKGKTTRSLQRITGRGIAKGIQTLHLETDSKNVADAINGSTSSVKCNPRLSF